jgi:hypothetical protein
MSITLAIGFSCMTQRWVFYGDGLLVPTTGFGETLLDHLLLRAPNATWQASLQGVEEMTAASAIQDLSWRVIGKAPHGVFLVLGAQEIFGGVTAADLLPTMREIMHLIMGKTHSQIHLFALPLAFFPEGAIREEARKFNEGLLSWVGGDCTHCDVNPAVDAFLLEHRQSMGEKRALHVQPTKPTQLGRLLLAQGVAQSWPWPLF